MDVPPTLRFQLALPESLQVPARCRRGPNGPLRPNGSTSAPSKRSATQKDCLIQFQCWNQRACAVAMFSRRFSQQNHAKRIKSKTANEAILSLVATHSSRDPASIKIEILRAHPNIQRRRHESFRLYLFVKLLGRDGFNRGAGGVCRPRAQGAVITAQGIGAALSTTLAGAMVVHAGYNAAFLTLAAVAAGGLLLFFFAMPETGGDQSSSVESDIVLRDRSGAKCEDAFLPSAAE